ncbi:M23 family metallopeptidase [Nocardioides sp.]|uniref:M23 family metallopeptidase n=1 Tax=Nocardioides sp. TaxID=35761 RepID=UPI003D0EE6C8
MKRLLLLLLTVTALVSPLLVTSAPAGAEPDPRWVFYTKDKTAYSSPWFGNSHRIMIGWGCTNAPYYAPDPSCTKGRGFHHGIDVAIGCRGRIFAGVNGWAVDHSSLGPAYGTNPLLIRNHARGVDIVIGHTRRVYVHPGDRIRKGDVIARVSDNGAPDGCHLHFEVRELGGGLSTAQWPRPLLGLRS